MGKKNNHPGHRMVTLNVYGVKNAYEVSTVNIIILGNSSDKNKKALKKSGPLSKYGR